MAHNRKSYIASPTLADFHASDAFVRLLVGPLGSGKSSACVIEIIRRATMQEPDELGVRRSRWAAVRNTYRELMDTTFSTFADWVPPNDTTNIWKVGVHEYTISFALSDKTTVELVVRFRALDTAQDVKKLLSMELTGAWLNEAREISPAIIKQIQGRVGRFPAGGGTWFGIILDSNPTDTQHYLYNTFVRKRPPDWELFHQPSGRSTKAENIKNLPRGYYDRLLAGQSTDENWIRVYVDGQWGFVADGKAVYTEYSGGIHLASEPIQPVEGVSILLGVDFGLTPSAVFGQRFIDGRWHIIDEYCTTDTGVVKFTEQLRAILIRKYPGYTIRGWGDPAGNQRAQQDERTCFQIMNAGGINVVPAPSNDFVIRREAVAVTLQRLVDGKPGFLLSPTCTMLKQGFDGGYKYILRGIRGEERYRETPDKNQYSHPHDGLQYLMLGAGEVRSLMDVRIRKQGEKPWNSRLKDYRHGTDGESAPTWMAG